MVSDLKISMITELNVASTLNSSDWWGDSGKIVHVCNNKTMFRVYEDVPNEHVVVMDNHDTAKVYGKGIVDLQYTLGKKFILTNVLHILNIRKNLVSADRLNKNGLRVY